MNDFILLNSVRHIFNISTKNWRHIQLFNLYLKSEYKFNIVKVGNRYNVFISKI